MFHQDSAVSQFGGCHGEKSMNCSLNCFITFLTHKAYPSNFFLFLRLKITLRDQKFSLNEETMTFINNCFSEKDTKYYFNGLKSGSNTGRSV